MWMVIVHLGERQMFRSIVQDYSTMLISNSFVINDSPRFLDSYTFKKSTILYLPPSLSSFFHSSLRVIPSSIFFCERFTTQWKPSCNLTSESRAMVTFDRVSLSRFCPGGNKIMADLGTCMSSNVPDFSQISNHQHRSKHQPPYRKSILSSQCAKLTCA